MHDKYYYESAEMALIDTDVRRTFATGIAGFSHVVDSLSAIRYAKVKVIRDEYGIARKFETEGDFPRYGNDDDRADEIAVWLLKTFLHKVKKYHTYQNSEATINHSKCIDNKKSQKISSQQAPVTRMRLGIGNLTIHIRRNRKSNDISKTRLENISRSAALSENRKSN